MPGRPLPYALLALVLVAFGCSSAEEGALNDRGDAISSEPHETGTPHPAASMTGGGTTGGSAVSQGTDTGIGQTARVFPPTAQPTGRAPERTYGFIEPSPAGSDHPTGTEHGPTGPAH